MPAPPIDQKITLSGADQVKAQLQDLGVTGEASFAKIAAAADASSAGFAAFGAPSAKIASIFQSLSTAFSPVVAASREFGSSLLNLGTAVEGLIPRFGAFQTLIGVGLVAGFADITKNAAEATHQLENQAESLGLTTEKYQALQLMAAQAGVEQDTFTTGMARLTAALGAAAMEQKGFSVAMNDAVTVLHGGTEQAAQGVTILSGATKALGSSMSGTVNVLRGAGVAATGTKNALSELGFTAQEIVQLTKDPAAAIVAITDKLSRVADAADRARIGQQLLGRGFINIIPAFAGGSEAINKAVEQLNAMGVAATEADKANSKAFSTSINTLEFALTQVKNIIGASLAPIFTPIFNAITTSLAANVQQLRDWATKVSQTVAPVIEDLVKKITDPASLTALKDTLVSIGSAIGSTFSAIGTVLSGAASVINTLTGGFTNLSGASLAAVLVIVRMTGAIGILSAAWGVASAAGTVFMKALAGIDVLLGTALVPTLIRFGILLAEILAPVVLVAGLIVIAAKVFGFWDQLKAVAIDVAGALSKVWTAFFNSLSDGWKAAIATTRAAAKAIFGIDLGSATPAASSTGSNRLISVGPSTTGPSPTVVRGGAGQKVTDVFPDAATAAASGRIAGDAWDDAFNVEMRTKIAQQNAALAQALVSWGPALALGAAETGAIVAQALLAPIKDDLTAGFPVVLDKITKSFIDGWTSAISTVEGLFQGLINAVESMATTIQNVIASIGGAIVGATSAAGNASLALPFAAGGHVPGSGSHDTVPAMLTPGEFVTNKAATAQHLPLLHAINSGMIVNAVQALAGGGMVQRFAHFASMPLRVVQGFSQGGMASSMRDLVTIPMPFAMSGLAPAGAGASHNLTLVLDGQRFSAQTDKDNFQGLTRHARGKAVRSGGTKPSWFRG